MLHHAPSSSLLEVKEGGQLQAPELAPADRLSQRGSEDVQKSPFMTLLQMSTSNLNAWLQQSTAFCLEGQFAINCSPSPITSWSFCTIFFHSQVLSPCSTSLKMCIYLGSISVHLQDSLKAFPGWISSHAGKCTGNCSS